MEAFDSISCERRIRRKQLKCLQGLDYIFAKTSLQLLPASHVNVSGVGLVLRRCVLCIIRVLYQLLLLV